MGWLPRNLHLGLFQRRKIGEKLKKMLRSNFIKNEKWTKNERRNPKMLRIFFRRPHHLKRWSFCFKTRTKRRKRRTIFHNFTFNENKQQNSQSNFFIIFLGKFARNRSFSRNLRLPSHPTKNMPHYWAQKKQTNSSSWKKIHFLY